MRALNVEAVPSVLVTHFAILAGGGHVPRFSGPLDVLPLSDWSRAMSHWFAVLASRRAIT